MDEKELKTSLKTRIFISIIAVLMLGSVVASYALIIANGSKGTTATSETEISEERLIELEEAYNKKQAEFSVAAQGDFEKFIAYKSEIRAYNEASANAGGISTRDLKVGSGRELNEGDADYLAYYVGWCADETVFDSSFNDNQNPTAFAKILDASLGMIEGWNLGIVGMKIGGVREVTISNELAYGDAMEICGGYNKPLKFLIMTKEKEGEIARLANELDTAYMRLQYANYGIDYDVMMSGN